MGRLIAHRRPRFWAASTAPSRSGFSGPPEFRQWRFSNWSIYHRRRRRGKNNGSTKSGGSESMRLTTSLAVDSGRFGYYPEFQERSEWFSVQPNNYQILLVTKQGIRIRRLLVRYKVIIPNNITGRTCYLSSTSEHGFRKTISTI
jgi:hypothetical protein